jgi:hypothetical protein
MKGFDDNRLHGGIAPWELARNSMHLEPVCIAAEAVPGFVEV